MRRLIALLLLALALSPPLAARADQSDARLDALFESLRAAAEPAAGKAIEVRIWDIWLRTDEPRAARLMGEGIEAMSRGAYPDALRSFDRLVELAPDFAEAWNKRATVHYLMGNHAASVADIIRTLELEPRHFGALSGLGLIYLDLGEPAAALRSFEGALAIDPHLEGVRQRVEELRRRVRGRPA